MARPQWMDVAEKADPELLHRSQEVRQFCMGEGALPARFKTLMGVFGDALLAHPAGVKALANQAREQGASEQEIAETVRMAFMWGGLPALVTAVEALRD